MATFIYNDFVTDDIPECPLSTSLLARQAAARILQDDIKITDAQIVGIHYNNEIVHEWLIRIEVRNEYRTMFLPLYLPTDIKQTAQQINIHSRIAGLSNLPIIPYGENDYLLIGYKYPCQIKRDEHNNLCLKRFEMFAAQKIIQEFFISALGCETVTAVMVVINMHSLCYKNLYDIGWLVNMDGIPTLTPLDRRYINPGFSIIDGYDELPNNSIFDINNQKYIVAEDSENGQFIAKISGKRSVK